MSTTSKTAANGPLARSVVRYEASTTQAGIHNVRLAETTVDGVPIGSVAELPIRAGRVSAIIWIVMAGGALLLFGRSATACRARSGSGVRTRGRRARRGRAVNLSHWYLYPATSSMSLE